MPKRSTRPARLKKRAAFRSNVSQRLARAFLLIDGQRYEVAARALQTIASQHYMLWDTEALDALAKHPCASVRAAVACNEATMPETLSRLFSTERDQKVLLALVSNPRFAETCRGPLTTLLDRIASNSEALATLASCVEAFRTLNVVELSRYLARHVDPEVRLALASNPDAPREVRGELAKDSDRSVAASAQRSLNVR